MPRTRLPVVLAMMVLSAAVLVPSAVGAQNTQTDSGGRAAGAGRYFAAADTFGGNSASRALALGKSESLVAEAAKGAVPIFESPHAVAPARALRSPTREGVQLIFGVLEEQGDWLKVMLPMRPNGSSGWVKAADVRVRKVSNRIVVDRSDKRLRAFRGSQVLFEAPVAVGLSKSPTPLARAYVDVSVPFKPASGAYGVYMLSVAAYSEVLTNFGGGVGQIAIHGTNNRNSIGKAASNGCIRMNNEDILRLKDLAPTGTPVEIVA